MLYVCEIHACMYLVVLFWSCLIGNIHYTMCMYEYIHNAITCIASNWNRKLFCSKPKVISLSNINGHRVQFRGLQKVVSWHSICVGISHCILQDAGCRNRTTSIFCCHPCSSRLLYPFSHWDFIPTLIKTRIESIPRHGRSSSL